MGFVKSNHSIITGPGCRQPADPRGVRGHESAAAPGGAADDAGGPAGAAFCNQEKHDPSKKSGFGAGVSPARIAAVVHVRVTI